jgi:MFS transporter, ACS family, solute carrier family 17 (sodium-dependent inorganic phosphate cotransporter), other
MIIWLLFAKDSPTDNNIVNNKLSTTNATTFTFATTTASAESIISFPDDNDGGRILTSKHNSSDMTIGSSWDASVRILQEAPWKDIIQSKGSWAILLAHSAKNWALYNTLSWTPTFYDEQYGIGVRESAILSVLPSLAGIIGGFVAGISVDALIRKLSYEEQQEQTYNDTTVNSKELVDDTFRIKDVTKTNVRKVFQGTSLYGGALALGALALHIPEEAWMAQTYLTTSVFLQAFGAAGFEGGNQDKAGPKWAGLLYSVTSLPAVMCKSKNYV